MAVVVEDNKPVLYKCPYCVKGRFTEDDGWEGAVKHIKENHQNGKPRTRRRRIPTARGIEDLDLLDEAAVG